MEYMPPNDIEDAVIYGDYNKVRELEEEIVQCLKKLKK